MLFVFLATEVYVQQGGQTSGNSVSVLTEPSWSRWEEKGGKKKTPTIKKQTVWENQTSSSHTEVYRERQYLSLDQTSGNTNSHHSSGL